MVNDIEGAWTIGMADRVTMDRRALLGWGATAMLVGMASRGSAAVPSPEALRPTTGFPIDAVSYNLLWCPTAADLGKAVQDLALKSVDLFIGPNGHIDPSRISEDLPGFVATLKGVGIGVSCVTLAGVDVGAAAFETTLAVLAGLDVAYYTFSALPAPTPTKSKALADGYKPVLARLARLNQKHKLKGLYQPGAAGPGAWLLDLLPAMQASDPADIGFRVDTSAIVTARPQQLADLLRLVGPYVGGVAFRDGMVSLDIPRWDQGRFAGNPKQLTGPDGGGDNIGNAGGNPLALGGGGRPLPYHYHDVPLGTGMIDLTLLGNTFKDIGFSGPAECQVAYLLGGAEAGAHTLSIPRQEAIGRMKRDRIVLGQAFEASWGTKPLLPPFMERQRQAAGVKSPPAAAGGDRPE